MDVQAYHEIMIQFIKNGISYSEDDSKIEEFYEFIDKLEELAQSEPKYYELVADCYMQMWDAKKAKAAFAKIYDKKNKKHIKKLYDYDRIECRPITRPSKRAKKLPRFQYADKKVIYDMFIKSCNDRCMICGKKNPVQYFGIAYRNIEDLSEVEEICYANEKDKFCAECLQGNSR